MRGRVCTVLAFAALLPGGCLFTTSLDGLSEPAALAGGDGGADTGVEAAAGDGQATADAAADARPPDFRCATLASVPAFCTDFDVGTLGAIIGQPNTAVGGVVTLDETIFRSPTRSMKMTVPSNFFGIGRASLERTFGFAPTKSIVVELDMRIDSADTSASNTVSLSMGSYDLSLFFGATSKLREGVPGDGALVYASTDRAAPPLARWFHVSLKVTIAAGASNAVIAYDGVAQSAVPLVIDRYLASWRIDLGLNYVSSPDDGRKLYIDNLVIDAK